MKDSVIYTNQQLVKVLNLPPRTVEFELHAKPGELPFLKVTTLIGFDEEAMEFLRETHEFKLELIPKQENGLG